jgi:hypothetical protein
MPNVEKCFRCRRPCNPVFIHLEQTEKGGFAGLRQMCCEVVGFRENAEVMWSIEFRYTAAFKGDVDLLYVVSSVCHDIASARFLRMSLHQNPMFIDIKNMEVWKN